MRRQAAGLALQQEQQHELAFGQAARRQPRRAIAVDRSGRGQQLEAQAHAVRRWQPPARRLVQQSVVLGFQHAVRTVHVPLLKNKKAAYHMAALYFQGPKQVTAGNGKVCYPRRNRYPDRPRQPGSCPSSLSQPNVRRLPCAACAWTTCPCCWPWSPTPRSCATAPASSRPRSAPPRTAGLAARGARQARPLGRGGRRRRGWASLTPLPGTDRIQLAYRLPARLGPGCATQPAASCATAWRMLDVEALSAVAWPDNLRRVLENSASSRPAPKRTTGATPWPICCRVRPRPDPRHHAYPFPGTIHS